MSPKIDVPPSDLLPAALRRRAEDRLSRWLDGLIRTVLAPLARLEAAAPPGAARGLAFQLREGLGAVSRAAARPQIAALTPADRKILRSSGLRFGVDTVFLPALLKPRAVRLRAILWSAAHHTGPYAPPAPGLVAAPRDPEAPEAFYAAIGFRVVGDRAIRIDMLDRVALRLLRLAKGGRFEAPADLGSLMGLGLEQTEAVIRALGYRRTADGAAFERDQGGRRAETDGRKGRRGAAKKNAQRRRPSESPFAQLADLRMPS